VIRPMTCIAFMLACASAFKLYDESHRVSVLDQEIGSVVRQIRPVREQTRFLKAEWALLARPDRLQELADQFSTLKPTDSAQFTSPAALDSRLPPVAPAGARDGPPATGIAPPASPRADPATELVASAAADPMVPSVGAGAPSSAAAMGQSSNPGAPPTRLQAERAPGQSQGEAGAGGSQPQDAETGLALPATAPPAPAAIDVAPASPPRAAMTAAPSPPAVAAPAQPSREQAEAARLSSQIAQLRQQRDAEAARDQQMEAEAARLAVQIAQQHKTLDAMRAQAAAAKPPSIPTPSPPPVAATSHPFAREMQAAALAAELGRLKQQREAETARTRQLQAEADRLAAQVAQQQKSMQALRAPAAAPKQFRPAMASRIAPAAASNFDAVRNVLARLRKHQVQTARARPDDLEAHDDPSSSAAEPASPGILPLVPRPSPPAAPVQYLPRTPFLPPWRDLMGARTALQAGDSYQSMRRLETARSKLLFDPSGPHLLAATQISRAMALIGVGEDGSALYFVDQALANAGTAGSYPAPYAAYRRGPPLQPYPPWSYR